MTPEIALQKAADQFTEYGRQHRAKGTPEADAKAIVNDEMARMCLAALAAPKVEDIDEPIICKCGDADCVGEVEVHSPEAPEMEALREKVGSTIADAMFDFADPYEIADEVLALLPRPEQVERWRPTHPITYWEAGGAQMTAQVGLTSLDDLRSFAAWAESLPTLPEQDPSMRQEKGVQQ